MEKTGRNDPCPCGSGKKYKQCCLPGETPAAKPQAKAQKEALTTSQMARLIALFNAGRHAELENEARSLVDRHPNSGFAWKIFGTVLQAQGKDGLPALKTAAELLPDDAELHSNIGIVLHNLGQLDDAVISCRRALRIKPDYAEAHCNLGISLHGLGQLVDAVASYRRALQIKPRHAEVHNNLGMALSEIGQLDDAVTHYRRALEIRPDYAEAHNNLGNALRGIGRHAEALASYRKALQIKPDHAEAHNNLGNVLRDIGQLDDAVASYRHALQIKPDYAEAHSNLGNALRNAGKLDEALACCRRALEIKPDYADAHNNLGNALRDLGRYDQAAASYRKALEIKPDFAEAYSNLGNALRSMGQLDDAMANYRQALQIRPDYAEAHNNFGNALWDIGQFDNAAENYRRAIQIKPNYAEAHYNLGNSLRDLGRFDEAIASYATALGIDPNLAKAHNNQGNVLRDCGRLDEALAGYRRALELQPDYVEAHDNLLMALQCSPTVPLEHISLAHRRFGEQFEAPLKPHWPVHANQRDPNRRLKIGYVSGDFRKHAVAYFIEPVFASHDKSQFEVFCYSNGARNDAFTDRLIAEVDHWQPCLSMSDDELARRIQADGIDILVDLAGHTGHNRLLTFARKPAPVQITYLGYPGTSGLSAMDYRLTDRYTEPEAVSGGDSTDRYYTEKLLRLPDSMWCYRPAEDMQEVTPLPALTNGYLTFGSFNNVNKVGAECIALWATLLRSLPTSRLLMVTVPEGEIRERLIRQFGEHGIGAERISFCGKLPSHAFQRMLQQVDLTLDPFPINGATTTCESLWLGVPVLTLVGERFLTRAGLSVLSAAQLPDFAAATMESYIKTATLLANNLPLLANIRAGLREHLRISPLLDQLRFTRNLEGIYRDVWRRWCNQHSSTVTS